MKPLRKHTSIGFICCTLLALLGCRAKPAPDAGFLQDTQLMKKDKQIPYNRVYLAEPVNPMSKYTEIYVAPVDISHLLPQNNIWEWLSTAYVFPEDVKKNHRQLAEYAREAFIKAIQKDPSKRFTVVDTPGPKTLILEMSLVQMIPAKPALNIATYISWIPLAVELVAPIVLNSEEAGEGVIAVEARLRDGGTGQTVGMFADRERPAIAFVNFPSFLWWEGLKRMIDGWARQFVEMMDGKRGKESKEIPQLQIVVF
jgi:hypothetical protein